MAILVNYKQQIYKKTDNTATNLSLIIIIIITIKLTQPKHYPNHNKSFNDGNKLTEF
jgi:hypothetical protein